MNQATTQKLTRRSRYTRDRKDVPDVVIGARDIQIFKTLYDFRFLRTDHLVRLIKGDRTSIEKRLAKLWRAYYLERIFLPIWPGRPKPSLKGIYALDKRGAEMLTDVEGINPTHLRHQIRDRQTGERYLKHYLMISNFRTILTLATEERRNLELLFFRHDKSLEDRVRTKGETYPVVPDAYIGLKDKEGKF